MRRVGVNTNDFYVYRKIELELSEIAEVSPARSEEYSDLWDTLILHRGDELILLRAADTDTLPYPYPLGALCERISSPEESPLYLHEGCAVLHGERIKLTDLEYSLLAALYEGEGFTSREELISRVFGNGVSCGMLNVYIHYLRQKLEMGGEKIILSSRALGYGIDQKYKGGKRT